MQKVYLTSIINKVIYGRKRVILTRNGKQLVAIVPLEELRALETLENKIDLEDAKTILQDIENNGTISWEDTEHQLGL